MPDRLGVLDLPTIMFWLVLAMLAYWLVTSVFSILAARNHFEISRHDLLVKSKQLRLDYLNSLEERIAGVETDDVDVNVDVIEDEGEPEISSKLAA